MAEKLYSSKYFIRQRNEIPNIFEYAYNKRIDGKFNDVTIKVGNKRFPANRMILSCCSEVFEKMFLSEMKEKYEDEIELKDVDESSMRKIIDFMYTGIITIDDNTDVINLLSTAEYFQLNEVKSFCSEYIMSVITSDNCFIILNVADRYSCNKLKEHVNRFISFNFDNIALTMGFKNLTEQELNFFFSGLDRNHIMETSLYEALITWIKHDEQNRQNKVDYLMQFIDFYKFSFDYLNDIVLKETLITNSKESLYILMNALSEINKRNKLKKSGSKILCFGGTETDFCILEIFSIFNETPKQYPYLPLPTPDHYSIKVEDIVYCIGGFDPENNGDDFLGYDTVWKLELNKSKLKWEKASPMNTKRQLFAAANFKNQIVITGGALGVVSLNSTEVYTPAFDEWRVIAPIQTSRNSHCMAECKGSLYAIGGADDNNEELTSVEQLSGLKSEWKYVKPMQIPRQDFAATSLNGFIYAIGGYTGSDSESIALESVERYDVSGNEWSYVQDLNTPRAEFDACVLDGKIYVVGGLNRNGDIIKEIECFDPETNSWTVVGNTKYKLFAFHSLIII